MSQVADFQAELFAQGVITAEQRPVVRRVASTYAGTVSAGKVKGRPTLAVRFATVTSDELAAIERAVDAAGLPKGAFLPQGAGCVITWVVGQAPAT